MDFKLSNWDDFLGCKGGPPLSRSSPRREFAQEGSAGPFSKQQMVIKPWVPCTMNKFAMKFFSNNDKIYTISFLFNETFVSEIQTMPRLCTWCISIINQHLQGTNLFDKFQMKPKPHPAPHLN